MFRRAIWSGRVPLRLGVRADSAVGSGFGRRAAAKAAAYARDNRSCRTTQSTRREGKVQWITFFIKEGQHTCIRLARGASNHDELRRKTATLGNMGKD